MFTGIIEEKGKVRDIVRSGASSRMTIFASKVLEDIRVGDSINTNGICLTVVSFDESGFTVEVMPETLRRTAFSELRTGQWVNLERALKLSDRLGGHLVSGHIDGTGRILRRWQDEIAVWYHVTADASLLRYMVDKGSVALDGISLTLAGVTEDSFKVSVIPHTWQETGLPQKQEGDLVNIECDMIAKYTERLSKMGRETGGIDFGFLSKHGFTD